VLTNILGVGVSPVNMESAIELISGWIENNKNNYVTVTGVHGVIESWRDKEICEIHNNAGLVVPDGMPLVWISQLKGQENVSRVYGPELMLRLCEHSLEEGYRHYLYGGAEGVPELLKEELIKIYPGLEVVGTYSPPFRPLTEDEDRDVIKMINEDRPDILWIGLSTPKQEKWMAEHLGKINTPVMIGVGAAFDFNAGLKKQAPGWMQKAGLEWLFRLLSEPGRLWKRYLINNPLFILLIMLQFLGIKKYPIKS